MEQRTEIKDTYFRRFFVPLIVTTLILVGVVCIITHTPGTAPKWNTYASVYEGVGGALKKFNIYSQR